MIVANFIVSAEWMFYGYIIDDSYVEVNKYFDCLQ